MHRIGHKAGLPTTSALGGKEIILKSLVSCFVLFVILACLISSYAGTFGNNDNMNKVYSDESHCLVASELRSDKDNPISCYCRDAIADARYVYENYLLTGKDRNLNGAYLTLEIHAHQMCGEHYDVVKAIQTKAWQWNGPEVMRQYPPDREINQIQPDNKGIRTVEYKVHLTYRKPGGGITNVENFTALERLPLSPKK